MVQPHLEQDVIPRGGNSINRLPNELLSFIFEKGNGAENGGHSFLSNVCLVCRTWHEVAVNAPALWRRITISSPSTRVPLWIKRAGALCLDVSTAENISQELHELFFSSRSPKSINPFMNIRTLELTDEGVGWLQLWPGHQETRLQSLIIHQAALPIHLTTILRVLSLSPSLVRLHLERLVFVESGPSVTNPSSPTSLLTSTSSAIPIICLPHLTSLSLAAVGSSTEFIKSLSLPNLRTLSVGWMLYEAVNPILGHISSSSHLISSCAISSARLAQATLLDFLSEQRGLVRLYLAQCELGARFFECLGGGDGNRSECGGNETGWICPRLEEISLAEVKIGCESLVRMVNARQVRSELCALRRVQLASCHLVGLQGEETPVFVGQVDCDPVVEDFASLIRLRSAQCPDVKLM